MSALGELKRRKIVQWGLAYLAAAWLALEVTSLVGGHFGWAAWVHQALIVLAVVGLPIALVLAWYHGEKGRQRVSGPELLMVAALLVVAGVAVAFVRAGAGDDAASESAVAAGDNLTQDARSSEVDAGPGVAAASSEEPAVAVLPFRDMSAERDQAWFGEGLAEEIHGGLTRIPDLRVVGRQSSFALADATIGGIGERLGVTHVLSGSVRTEGNRARIRALLTEVDDERVLWSREFRPTLSSVLDAQEEIARAVVEALEIELGPVDEARIIRASTADPEAHEHYLRGLQQWNRRSESAVLSAIDHFREAVELDSTYAAAWAGLAYAYLVLPEYSPTADVRRIRSLSEQAGARALEIDPGQTDALTALGWARMIHHYDWEGAEELIGRALALDSTNVRALHWQSHVVSWQGRHREAVALARRATELDPLSSIMRQNLAFILMEAREYDQALRELDRVLSVERDFNVSLRSTWNIHTRAGRYEAAAAALRRWLVQTGRDAVAARKLAENFRMAAARFGRTGQPGTLSRELVDRLQPGLEVTGQLYAAVGDRERTLELLEQAYRERAGSRNVLSMKVNPLYDFLRDDPRFQDLLRRINLSGDPTTD